MLRRVSILLAALLAAAPATAATFLDGEEAPAATSEAPVPPPAPATSAGTYFGRILAQQVSAPPQQPEIAVAEIAAAVPEPATWAMLVGGFSLVGFGIRRRRRPALSLA